MVRTPKLQTRITHAVLAATFVCLGFGLLICSVLTYPLRADLAFISLSTLGTYLHPYPAIFMSSLVSIGVGLLFYFQSLTQISTGCCSTWHGFTSTGKWHAVLLAMVGIVRYDHFPLLHLSAFLVWIVVAAKLGHSWRSAVASDLCSSRFRVIFNLAFPALCLLSLPAFGIAWVGPVAQKVIVCIIALWYARVAASVTGVSSSVRVSQSSLHEGTEHSRAGFTGCILKRIIAGGGIGAYSCFSVWADTKIDWASNFPARIPSAEVCVDCTFADVRMIRIGDHDITNSPQELRARHELPVSIQMQFRPGSVRNGQPLFMTSKANEVDESLPRATVYVELLRFSTLDGGTVRAASCRDRVFVNSEFASNQKIEMRLPAMRGSYLCVVKILRTWQRNRMTTQSELTTAAAFPVCVVDDRD